MERHKQMTAIVLAGLLALAGPMSALAQKAGEDIEAGRANPEAASGFEAKNIVRAKRHMVVAANPYAARAGREILRMGGSAIDAAIATQLVLNLVEPQSSGIGGGAFILHWDKAQSELKTYDGRERAPKAAKPDLFLTPGGAPQRFFKTVASPQSVAVPGLLRALEMAHKSHGQLPWKDLFAPAIRLAEQGFKVSPRLHKLLGGRWARKFSPRAKEYFFNAGNKPWPVGHVLKNPEFADTLRHVAARGADAFYQGGIARDMVGALQAAVAKSGQAIDGMTAEDVKSYQAMPRPPVCTAYRSYKICGMGPPSSGGHTVAQTLKLVEKFDLGRDPMNPAALHIIAEAEKLAYADRARYSADPDFVPVPEGLLDPDYLNNRAKLIDLAKSTPKAQPGTPPEVAKGRFGRDATIENKGTSHISIVDRQGNAVAMTSTIESAFGSGFMVRGFLLNNEMTDFSFRPKDRSGRPIANRIEPLKRPRSSMAPTMIFAPDGELRMILGSPGGSRIILYVIKSIIAHIDWNANAAEAAAWPNFGSRNGPFEIESGQSAPASANVAGSAFNRSAFYERTRKYLEARGHKIRSGPMTSGAHIIILKNGVIEGGADPRREGRALGD